MQQDAVDARKGLVEFECESKCFVDFPELIWSDTTNEVTESFGCNSRRLFHEHLRFLVVDRDGWRRTPLDLRGCF
jgi:hypothetical protein